MVYFKLILFIFYFLLSAYSYADITTGLVAWWKFDEGSGATTADSSGQGYTGTLTNAPTWITGKFADALKFNGASTQYVSTADAGPTSGTAFTVAFWIKTTSTTQPAGKNTQVLMAWGNSGSCGSPGYAVIASVDGFGANDDDTGLTIDYRCYDATIWASAIVYDGNWQHVALTGNGSKLTAYRNGVVQSFGASDDNQRAVGVGDNVRMGMGVCADCGPLTGSLDDVRIYNRALSAQDVMTLYLGGNMIRNGVLRNFKASN